MPSLIKMNLSTSSNTMYQPASQPSYRTYKASSKSGFFKSSMLGRIDAGRSKCGTCSGVK